MRVLSYVVPAEDDGRLIRRVARGRLGISSHQLARAKALGALCLVLIIPVLVLVPDVLPKKRDTGEDYGRQEAGKTE